MNDYMIKQYSAKEQAELRVRVMLPGSWHGFNNLTPTERSEQYEAEAFDWEAVHKLPKKGARAAQTCEAVKFLCLSDVLEDPAAAGFTIPLFDWNRYRHYTYQNIRHAEKV